MMDLLKTLYGEIGAPYPILSLVIAAILGAALFGGGWWLIGKQYSKERSSIAQGVSSHPSGGVKTPPSALGDMAQPSTPQPSGSSQTSNGSQRPTAIRIEGGKNITIKNNVGIGDMDLIDAKNVENLDADNNILINPDDAKKK
jgi:hypothetical protein